jgi:hypothetical protein
MKEGQSLSSRAQGGVLCAPKNKKTKYYEIRRQGKTKPEFSFFENKLKFNLKKREFTRFWPLSLAALSSFSPSFVPSPITHHVINHQLELLNDCRSHLVSINDQPLSIN